jgi:hypothetical protein
MKIWTACALLLIPALAASQSLGEAARKEAERRKKAQATGTPAAVLGDEQLSSARDKRARESEPPLDAQPAPQSPSAPAAPAAPGVVEAPAATITEEAPAEDDLDRDRKNRADEEARWRGRLAAANAALDRASRVYERLKVHTLVPGEYLVDSAGQTIAASPEQLQRLVAQAKEEYEAAEKALEDLRETARREGVPAGWLY